MNENLKTIKELADEFKVSKQAIRNRITTDFRNKHVQVDRIKGVNVLFINECGYKELKKHFTNDTNKVQSTTTNDTNIEIKYLKRTVQYQNEQIEDLKSQREELSKFLDQQQRLALQDKKMLEEYKAEISDLKALKNLSEDTRGGQVDNQQQDELEKLRSENKILQEQLTIEQQKEFKKWWKFWK